MARNDPLGGTGFLSLLTSVGIAGFLFWRLDGWRRVKKNKKKLQDLKKQIESKQIEAEKIID